MGLGISHSITDGLKPKTRQPAYKKWMDFNGSSSQMATADANALSFGDETTDSDFSFFCWVLIEDHTTDNNIIRKSSEYEFGITSARKIYLKIYDGSAGNRLNILSSSAEITADKWYLIGFTCDNADDSGGFPDDGSECKIYKNGVEVTCARTETGTYVAMHNTTQLLTWGRATSAYLHGNIAVAILLNAVPTDAKIRRMFNRGRPVNWRKHFSSNIVGYWIFGNDSNDTVDLVNDLGPTRNYDAEVSKAVNRPTLASGGNIKA